MTNSGVSREADAQAGSTQTNHAWNSLAWDHSAPFMRCFEVRAEHIDALAHTNNTIYVNWCMETASGANAWLRYIDRIGHISQVNYHFQSHQQRSLPSTVARGGLVLSSPKNFELASSHS